MGISQVGRGEIEGVAGKDRGVCKAKGIGGGKRDGDGDDGDGRERERERRKGGRRAG